MVYYLDDTYKWKTKISIYNMTFNSRIKLQESSTKQNNTNPIHIYQDYSDCGKLYFVLYHEYELLLLCRSLFFLFLFEGLSLYNIYLCVLFHTINSRCKYRGCAVFLRVHTKCTSSFHFYIKVICPRHPFFTFRKRRNAIVKQQQ